MNERIRELAEQSGSTHKQSLGVYQFFAQELEAFALAIVQDCVNEIETYQVPVGNSRSGELAAEWTMDALRDVRANIWERFGIEND